MLGIAAIGGKWMDDNSMTLAVVILPPNSVTRYS